jgi:hypothetical protein
MGRRFVITEFIKVPKAFVAIRGNKWNPGGLFVVISDYQIETLWGK